LLGGLLLQITGFSEDLNIMEIGFPNIFFLVLIAPIIFESAYNTNKKIFYSNLGSILIYAFIGTFLAAVVSSSLIYALGYYGLAPVLPFNHP
jgi:NhaP-type Na+/H+ or K+/H+ antiporter